VVRRHRDRHLADALLSLVKGCCQPLVAVVVLTDGWAASPGSIRRTLREKVKGVAGRGCSRWPSWPEIVRGTVITHTATKRVGEVIRRVRQGEAFAARALVVASRGGAPWTPAFMERVHATVRERLASLTRRCRHAARKVSRREAGMWLVGGTSPVCWPHHAWSRRAARGQDCRGDVLITPARASGLTDPVWSVRALLTFRIPPAAWVAPKRRRRNSRLISPRKKPVSARPRPLLRLRKGAFCTSTREG